MSGPFEAGPCVDEPEPGVLFAATLRVEISTVPEGYAYKYSVSSASDSRTSIWSLTWFRVFNLAFDPVPGWDIPDRARVERDRNPRFPSIACAMTLDLDGKFDIRPGDTFTLVAHSPLLPGITALRAKPRRKVPCLPTTKEEEEALRAKNYPPERLDVESLADEETYIVRLMAIVPVFSLVRLSLGREAVFAAAVGQLEANVPVVEYGWRAAERGFEMPWPVDRLEAIPSTSLEALRDEAFKKSHGKKYRGVIQQLYEFYSKLPAGKKDSAAATPPAR